ncbi:LytTR family DNA-binding domain-containing protein [Algibacter sp. L4_22]|uniref:LytR/AlgR family response regulator transcription factor n=1 Tax=Algibacter sp. L4_22 TaxID=2942477 RepID=UPI00201B5364|nr:LytTR family DNA-binding domain-containing protein [Algibacter sp. L4_22]MCL5130375.1 LytTR family DNA-binding domain-containing protein [Algibacter sp. L4_22]
MNKPYSTLIIDDEPLARTRLEKLLLNFPERIDVVGFSINGREAKQQIEVLKPDLIFLDIEMPVIDGFELIEALDKIPLIVFCTAHDEYALKAFETNSVDYLVKPVRLERLEKTIAKLELFNKKDASQDILKVVRELSAQKKQKVMTSITVKKDDKLIFIKLEDIIYFEANDKYVSIVTNKGVFLTEKSLTQLETQLPDYFLRVHRAFVINTNYVEEVQKYFNSRFIFKLNNKGVLSVTSGRSYSGKIKTWMSI